MKLIDNIKPEINSIAVYKTGKPAALSMNDVKTKTYTKLSSNENPLGTSKEVLKVIKNSIDNLNIYPDGNSSDVKQALSDFYKINPDNIIIGNGSEEIIDMLINIMISPGEEVIFANPTFIKYEITVKKFSGICIKVPLNDQFQHDLNEMYLRINEKTKVIFICNPNNPTGTVVDKEELKSFIKKVREDILIVIDEAYYEYMSDASDPKIFELIKKHENVVLLRTFSKAYGLAGLRVGYCIAQPQLITILNKVRNPFNVNTLAQTAASAALNDQQHVSDSKEFNEAGKLFLYKHLNKIGYQYIATEANFMMINVKTDSEKVYRLMLEEGIVIRPGNSLGLPNWIRVTIGRIEDNKKIIKILKKVKRSE